MLDKLDTRKRVEERKKKRKKRQKKTLHYLLIVLEIAGERAPGLRLAASASHPLPAALKLPFYRTARTPAEPTPTTLPLLSPCPPPHGNATEEQLA